MISRKRKAENLPDAILSNGDIVDFKLHEETPKEFIKDVNTIFADATDKVQKQIANSVFSVKDDPFKIGGELLDEAAKEPTLDRYLDGNPKIINPNYPELVANLHRKREMFITAEQKRKSGEKDEE